MSEHSSSTLQAASLSAGVEADDSEHHEFADDAPLRMLTKADAVKVELINWHRGARPVEVVLLLAVLGLTWPGLFTLDWLHSNFESLEVHAGLRVVHIEGNGTISAWNYYCYELDPPMCSLAMAGSTTSMLIWISTSLCLLLCTAFVAEALDERELLGHVRSALPPSLAPERLAVLPLLGWSLIYCLVFAALIIYSVAAKLLLGNEGAHLGTGFGRLRLALILILCATVVHLTLIQRIGEDNMIELLDMMKGHWDGMSIRKKGCQVLLLFALFVSLLLWIQRTDWGILVLLYGLWAQHTFSSRHIATFTCVLGLSICTDALDIAGFQVEIVTSALAWAILLCKLAVFATLVSQY